MDNKHCTLQSVSKNDILLRHFVLMQNWVNISIINANRLMQEWKSKIKYISHFKNYCDRLHRANYNISISRCSSINQMKFSKIGGKFTLKTLLVGINLFVINKILVRLKMYANDIRFQLLLWIIHGCCLAVLTFFFFFF